MADVISVLVVLVFIVIVFRKRLSLLFGDRTKKDEAPVKEPDGNKQPAVRDRDGDVYIRVVAVDTNAYLKTDDIASIIEIQIHDALRSIYTDYVGSFAGLDVLDIHGIVLILIRWTT